MKALVLHSAFLALLGLILSPLAVAHASSPPAEGVHFCAPFDYGQQRREHPRPAAKRLALNVGAPRTVRMIYFLPNDRPYRQEVVNSMKVTIRRMQTFYANQMQAHGYGNITFRFETDATGEPLVHRVDGQHPNSYYWVPVMSALVLGEIEQTFDLEENIYFIVVDDAVVWDQVGGQIGRNSGFALLSRPIVVPPSHVAEHELGHAFGLPHDFRDSNYIMSYGFLGDWDELSVCDARFLSVHPYFNPDVVETSPPTIEITSSLVRAADATSVPVRLKLRDSDGLHQVILSIGGYEVEPQVKECRNFEGEKEAVVNFDYDGIMPSNKGSDFDSFKTHPILIYAIDVLGNVGSYGFDLVNNREFRTPVAMLPGHDGGGGLALSFSPDGKSLASGGMDYLVKLWDVSSRSNVATLPGHTDQIYSVSFSPDGKLLSSGGYDGTIQLWDVSSRSNVATLPGHRGGVYSVPFSPDGTLLASGGLADYLVKLWDVLTGEAIATLSGHGSTVRSVIFSPDGTLLASGASDGIKLWDVSSGELVSTLTGYKGGWWEQTFFPDGLSFSPDGTLLASGGGPRGVVDVKLWDVSTGKIISTLSGSSPVSFSPDGKLLALGSGHGLSTIKLWDMSAGKFIYMLSGANGIIGELSFSPDGKLLASGSYECQSEEPSIMLWDISEIGQATADSDSEEGDGELDEGEEDEGEMVAFAFASEVEDQAYTAGTAISALVLPEATGGEGEITYRVSGLPAGLSFDDSTRTISGTPTAATDGAVEITYTAADSAGVAATLTFSITVNLELNFGDFFDLFGGG